MCIGRLTGKCSRAMNMGSYNYLGFAQSTGACADDAELTTCKSGVSVCSSRHELGISLSRILSPLHECHLVQIFQL